MRINKIDQPGASVLVIKNGQIVYNESFGLANVETKAKNSSETNYRIASVSKQFTAMALMLLIEQGKLEYNTKLTEIFSQFPKYGDNITVRQLMTHQSGLIDYYEFIDDDRGVQASDAEVLDNLMTLDSCYFEPGSQFQYSNSGYAVLARIVEKVSGESFADFMQQEIFEKLNMSSTRVFEVDQFIENRAYGYSFKNDSIIFNDQSVTSAIQGDGGIYTSVMDYYKWDQALYTDKLLPKGILADAFSIWDNNKKTNKDGYGYGWYIDYNNGIKLLNHSGGTAGFQTRVSRIPSLKLSVVIFSNHDEHDRNLMHNVNALTSIFSAYKIPMPIDIMMKKEIDQQGVSNGIEIYDQLKNNSKYKYEKTTLSYLGFEYYRAQKKDEAEALFIKSTQELPNYFGGYYGLARVYASVEKLDKAILNYKKVIEVGAPGEEWMVVSSKEELDKLEKIKASINKG